MHLFVFAVYDDKAKSFLPPFFLPNKAMALRTFGDCVNSAEHAFARHPADYSLFSFGSFDADAGKFLIDAHMELIANGVMCKEPMGSMVSNGQGSLDIPVPVIERAAARKE